MQKKIIINSLFIVVMLTGCSGINFTEWRFPYMYPVQQGNYITQQQFNALKVGMTKDQVAGVVGNPVSQFMFNAKQWQYTYQQYKNDKLVNSYVININFDKNDLLFSVESAGEIFVQ
ncbi:MAG: outer membrane protein assembly factor BamE [Proteobacteria bacterium]|nr:MAG: outer membrane protein assembly factor BamE [Pseudomonadota bacterium]